MEQKQGEGSGGEADIRNPDWKQELQSFMLMSRLFNQETALKLDKFKDSVFPAVYLMHNDLT